MPSAAEAGVVNPHESDDGSRSLSFVLHAPSSDAFREGLFQPCPEVMGYSDHVGLDRSGMLCISDMQDTKLRGGCRYSCVSISLTLNPGLQAQGLGRGRVMLCSIREVLVAG